LIYVVLGMHKSGTTLVAEVLHHSGINMGDDIDDDLSYDRGNKYERESTLWLDMDILGVQDDSVLHLQTPETLQMTPEHEIQMQRIIRDCNQKYTHWGFKDPRASLVYPLWAAELPKHKIIAVFRSPAEIWPRFRYNGLRYVHTNPLRAWEFISRWCEHNKNILTYLQNTAMDYLVLNYRELVTTQAEFDRLQVFVGLDLKDRRRTSLYRTRSQKAPLLNLMIRLYSIRNGYVPERIIEQLEALRK